MTELREPKEIAPEIHATVTVLNALYAEASAVGVHCDLNWKKIDIGTTEAPDRFLLVCTPVLRVDL